MILGIGSDLVNRDRIKASRERLGMRLLTRVFTNNEISEAEAAMDTIGYYARCWTAKEATLKAIGTGLRADIAWRDIETSHLIDDRPRLRLLGGAAAYVNARLYPLHLVELNLTFSEAALWTQAFVIFHEPGTSRPVDFCVEFSRYRATMSAWPSKLRNFSYVK
jgi:holo-[acyl-carrier protein] synthase